MPKKECYPPKRSGVYKITCAPTGKVYVGSAACMYTRWHAHQHHLREKSHHNRYLQNAWNKHGPSAFEIEVIEEAANAVLVARERLWMQRYRSREGTEGFNLVEAGSCRGIKRSSEYLKAMADRKAKHWIVTSPTGEEHAVKNLTAFCREAKLNFSMLHRVASGRARHFRGWLCRKATMTASEWERRRPKVKPNTRFKPGNWTVFSPQGKMFRVTGLSAFCKSRGLNPTAMINVAKGFWRQYRGWTCQYAKEGSNRANRPVAGTMGKPQQPATLSAG